MQYVVAGLIILVLFLCLYILKLKGYRITRIKRDEMPDHEKEKARKRAEEFEKVMNYNLEKALERKRVS